MKVAVDFNHLLNEKPLAFLREKGVSRIPFALPNEVKDPYIQQGSHPDVVGRLWDEIGKALPADGKCLVYGTPALVHCPTGILMGICGGTNYYLRLAPNQREDALAKGAEVLVESTLGDVFDVAQKIGLDWVCADWDEREKDWLRDNYAQFLTMPKPEATEFKPKA